ncbi:hypothetical protein ABGB07_21545 [Micromonosporaceae bacterium B7E4]
MTPGRRTPGNPEEADRVVAEIAALDGAAVAVARIAWTQES